MSRSRPFAPAAVLGAGVVVTVLTALAAQLPARDAVVLVVYAAGGAAIAGVVAGVLLRLLRGASVVLQAVVAGLAGVAAVAIGVAFASSRMFISSHDLRALFVVLSAAGTVGVLASLLIGQRVAAAGRSIGAMARHLGDEGPGADLAAADLTGTGASSSRRSSSRRSSPSELTTLADELQLTSERLAEAQEKTGALERSRRELVAWVSHDLRTPLAGIRAMVEALEDGVVEDPATVARYHRTMRQESDRLAGLVDDLFELSRIQAGALSLDLERVALDELVSEAVAGASIAAGAKGIELRGAVGEPSPMVELSTPEMARVVRNLLDNAIRHTPAGGTIWIRAGLDDSGTAAEVSVLDACGGIPEREIDQVFEMAFRGDEARTPGDGGAGLGLAVARGLVEAHRGEITVVNEGRGCRFTVRLPLSGTSPRVTS